MAAKTPDWVHSMIVVGWEKFNLVVRSIRNMYRSRDTEPVHGSVFLISSGIAKEPRARESTFHHGSIPFRLSVSSCHRRSKVVCMACCGPRKPGIEVCDRTSFRYSRSCDAGHLLRILDFQIRGYRGSMDAVF